MSKKYAGWTLLGVVLLSLVVAFYVFAARRPYALSVLHKHGVETFAVENGSASNNPIGTGIQLNGHQMTDDDLALVTRLGHVEVLSINKSRITDASRDSFAQLTDLIVLYLMDTSVSDLTVKKFAGMKHLKSLHLDRTNVTAGCLSVVAKLPSLENLTLIDTNISVSAIDELQDALPNCTITYVPERDEEFRNAAAAIEDMGGGVSPAPTSIETGIDGYIGGKPTKIGFSVYLETRRSGTAIPLELLEPVRPVVAVIAEGKWIADDQLKTIAELPYLEHLFIKDTSITVDGIERLLMNKPLKRLSITHVPGQKWPADFVERLTTAVPGRMVTLD